jgi:hypothetical protein
MPKPKTSRRVARTTAQLPTPAELIDQTLKRAWDKAMKQFTEASTHEAERWDAKWEAVDQILHHDPPLYLAASIRSEAAFVAKYLPGVSRPTARSNARVARYFDATAERIHGTSKLSLLLDYLEAGDRALPPIGIDPVRTKVRLRRKGTMESIAFPQLTFDELRAAVRLARGQSARSKTTDPPRLAIVRTHLAKKKLGTVGLRGRTADFDVLRIAYEDANDLGRALTTLKLPRADLPAK